MEFVAQLFQLIRGGREESLQARGTREILRRLASQNRLTQTEADTLLAAYAFWRAIEHRLQYEETPRPTFCRAMRRLRAIWP